MSDADTDATTDEHDTTVLVVDDERGLADLYTIWLEDDYDVKTAYSGTEAIDAIDPTIDVALLDRQMPDVSGDDVLDELRERGIECRVAMVTAVEPELDIIDLGFDDYLQKPVDRDTLLETVGRLQRRSTYDDTVAEFFAAARKQALLSESDDPTITDSAEFSALESDLASLRDDLDDVVADFDDADYEVLFRQLSGPDGDTDDG
ncbi:response regulator [Halobacterium salinarum]|uniref:response regulator n=1 Tax=Halobacterium TaxID=2239 RepID=UPI0019662081|nr:MULTISPECIES: response regulator [Halobacterium]MCF2166446.1 response regulator [Halobacterium salinarum]MCF2168389.1 response regulator [Halobacterium salinarum]MDL0140832.1 response regulator [Halobacterium salinarum]QRY23390.1 response regulator [Halobacterium sp. GSL-19]WJK64638.1 response regulator [Halobacterium salinarum]